MNKLISILIFFGWRGGECENCGFTKAAHHDHSIQWHPDFYPCNEFKYNRKGVAQ